jgi:hypothetical protein
MAFASDLFSLLENPAPNSDQSAIPALDTLSICLVPLARRLGPVDQDQLLRAVEAQRSRSLRTFNMYAMKFTPSAATLRHMESLREQGMQIDLSADRDLLYATMVDSDFRLYDDHYRVGVYEMFLFNENTFELFL